MSGRVHVEATEFAVLYLATTFSRIVGNRQCARQWDGRWKYEGRNRHAAVSLPFSRFNRVSRKFVVITNDSRSREIHARASDAVDTFYRKLLGEPRRYLFEQLELMLKSLLGGTEIMEETKPTDNQGYQEMRATFRDECILSDGGRKSRLRKKLTILTQFVSIDCRKQCTKRCEKRSTYNCRTWFGGDPEYYWNFMVKYRYSSSE